MGDSNDTQFKSKINMFFNKLDSLKELQSSFTLIIDDPLNNSFMQNPYYPNEDTRVTVEEYERTDE